MDFSVFDIKQIDIWCQIRFITTEKIAIKTVYQTCISDLTILSAWWICQANTN